MVDRAVATVGLMLAGLAAVAGLLAWPDGVGGAGLVAVGGAAVAAIAFSAGRHGAGGRRPVAAVAGVGAAGAVAGAVGSMVGIAGSAPATEQLPAFVVLFAGGGALVVAGAVGREVPRDRLFEGSQLVIVGAAVGAVGLYVAGLAAMLAVVVPELLVGELGELTVFGLRQVGVGTGFVMTSLAYVVLSGRGVEYLDFAWPGRRDVRYMAGGIVAILFVGAAVAAAYWLFDVPTTEHALHRRGREEGAEFILLAIPFTWVGAVIGEELLYRNVIQKYLTEGVSAVAAILASSAIFALVHVPAYSPAAPISVTAAILAVFGISLVLAVAYHLTRNVVVPMVIHGCYNVVVYIAIYLELIGVV